eukprot:TRINITY_DN10534_c0_g1_i8.p1 TRINITY_DN10534_c0_g1~~TRINITY_DN10534_c0_g1_i8.p1  ORF type:complete len:649 (-),score=122.69 TRINITY_DN10534_c0_g1_i8:30-1976(-)
MLSRLKLVRCSCRAVDLSGMELLRMLTTVATFKNEVWNTETHRLETVEDSPFLIQDVMGVKYLVISDAFIDYLTQSLQASDVNVAHYPMVVLPLPWTNPIDGGYFTTRIPIIRFLTTEQLEPIWKRSDMMEPIYEGLNALGAVPWKINKRLAQIVEVIWQLGGDMVEIPSRFDVDPPVPGPEGQTPEWYKAYKKVEKLNDDNYSLRSSFLLKLNVIRKFIHEREFYFPHNMDFRGRVYPIPGHLNHIGSDLGRGLLCFARGKPLGKRGWIWLQIHLANVAGYSKATHGERLRYVAENLEEFIEVAEQPLSGSRSWMKKDEPWQYLAACIEFNEALKLSNPEDYVSYLPVHQDGSCNGLQHYSALAGDPLGARSVNVLPSEQPQDVYTEVLKLIEMKVAKDKSEGHPMAILLDGKIQRSVVKQTIMTSVYGVTFIGGRKQIEKNLLDRFPNFPEERLFEATMYITKHIFDSLGQVFNGANAVKKWLADAANVICKNGNLLTWITPLGLPVCQPYRKPKRFDHVRTLSQNVLLKKDKDLHVNPRRHATAFPPNYVHSLDSTHMFLTAIMCYRFGITYASVHDSFWTHACTVDEMGSILRDQFIELYKRPLLEELRSYWVLENPEVEIPPLPNLGVGFDIKLVRHSPYFFS